MANSSIAVVLLRLVLAVGVVVGLLLLTARLTRRVGTKSQGTGRATLRVLARQPLSRNASVAIVSAGSRTFIIGVTDAHVTLLGETDLDGAAGLPTDALPPELSSTARPSPGTSTSFLEALRQRTLRR